MINAKVSAAKTETGASVVRLVRVVTMATTVILSTAFPILWPSERKVPHSVNPDRSPLPPPVAVPSASAGHRAIASPTRGAATTLR